MYCPSGHVYSLVSWICLDFIYHFRFLVWMENSSISSFCLYRVQRRVKVSSQVSVRRMFSIVHVKLFFDRSSGSFWSICRSLCQKSRTKIVLFM